MHRFFVQPEVLAARNILLAGEVAHQISRVLRMRIGDLVVLLDGSGLECTVRLTQFNETHIHCELVESAQGEHEPAHPVHLYLALLNKPDKFEWALQKCTELGAAGFTPIACERTISGSPERTRRERWERIITEAAEQSGRSRLPTLHAALSFHQAAALVADCMTESSRSGQLHLALLPAPGAPLSLTRALAGEPQATGVSVFIGPEGGFTEREVYEASTAGIRTVTLGPRTLRSETAAVASLTLVLQGLGELG